MRDERPYRLASSAGSTTYVFLVCIVAALGGLLFGYDTGVINGAIGPLKAHFELDEVLSDFLCGKLCFFNSFNTFSSEKVSADTFIPKIINEINNPNINKIYLFFNISIFNSLIFSSIKI